MIDLHSHSRYQRVIRLPDNRGQCLACGKVLSCLAHARRHYGLVHREMGQQEPAHKCHVCSYSTRHSEYLKGAKKHVASHRCSLLLKISKFELGKTIYILLGILRRIAFCPFMLTWRTKLQRFILEQIT